MESMPVSDSSAEGYFLIGHDSKYTSVNLTFVSSSIMIDYFIHKNLLFFFNSEPKEISHRMVLVCGTSTCHMAISREKLFIPGVWGPFWSGMS